MISNLLGFLGSFILLVPFFKENRLSSIIEDLKKQYKEQSAKESSDPKDQTPTFSDFLSAAKINVENHKITWIAYSYSFGIIGLSCLILSFVLKMIFHPFW